jgi:hypothetical protein
MKKQKSQKDYLFFLLFLTLLIILSSPTILACNTNSDCSEQSNGYCDILNKCHYCPTGKYYSSSYAGCVECMSSSECNEQSNGVCGILRTCFYCSGNTPFYEPTSNKCVECLSSSNCNKQDGGNCNIMNECHYCPTGTYYSLSYGGKCIECSSDSQCTAQSNGKCGILQSCFYCSGSTSKYSSTSNKCVECNQNSDCTAQSNGGCDTTFNTCHYCSGDKPYYNPYMGQCSECKDNQDCTKKPNGICNNLLRSCSYPSSNTQTVNYTCSDSDNGKDYYKYGETSGYYQGGSVGDDDQCVTSPSNLNGVDTGDYVLELYCANNTEVDYAVYKCPNGCNKGLCLSEPRSSEVSIQFTKAPEENSIVSGSFEVSVHASSKDPIDQINIYFGHKSEGKSVQFCNGVDDCDYTLDTTKFANGDYSIFANARNSVDLQWTSTEDIHIQIDNSNIPAQNSSDNSNSEEAIVLNPCIGCKLNDKCYPINNRKGDKYCSIDKDWSNQKSVDEVCDNNFECQSNVCASGKCIDANLLQKIINWFKALFGI